MTCWNSTHPIRARLDRIKCSSDGMYVSGHNIRAGLGFAMGKLGPTALDETEHIIRLIADCESLEVQSRIELSATCQQVITEAWEIAVLGDGSRRVTFKVVPVIVRTGDTANG